jgi:hypothetical protein
MRFHENRYNTTPGALIDAPGVSFAISNDSITAYPDKSGIISCSA